MIAGSCKYLKSYMNYFTHGIGISNHQFQAVPYILEMFYKVRQDIIMV